MSRAYEIFWANGEVRNYPGIGSTAVGIITGERGNAGVPVAPHLRMVDLRLDEPPEEGLSRDLTVCVINDRNDKTVH